MTGEATAKSLSPSRWALAGGAGLVIIAIVLLRTGGGSARPLLAVLGAAGILSCCWGLTTMLRIQRGAVEDAPASESPPLSEEQPAPTIQPPFRADRGPGDTSSGVPAVTTPGPPPLTPKPPANRPPPSPVEAYATPPSPPPSTP
ncbi:MAG: hypothetical protein OER86_10150, partial [Phycisphaerae bacterium]|nr:hypothetical protein [Phycisphaerae bacterium]